MRTVGSAVCTMRANEGFTLPHEVNLTEMNSTDKHTHTHTLTCTQEIQEVTCRSTRRVHEGDVCMCVTKKKKKKKNKTKRGYDTKSKNNKLCEKVCLLMFIFLPPLHLHGQKFTGYKFTNTKYHCIFSFFKIKKC